MGAGSEFWDLAVIFLSWLIILNYIMFNSVLFAPYEFGRVDQLGMIAALATLARVAEDAGSNPAPSTSFSGRDG